MVHLSAFALRDTEPAVDPRRVCARILKPDVGHEQRFDDAMLRKRDNCERRQVGQYRPSGGQRIGADLIGFGDDHAIGQRDLLHRLGVRFELRERMIGRAA